MDADRQNDPADVPTMLAKLAEGHDVVNGYRINRKDNALLRKIPSRAANMLIARTSGVALQDRGCSLRAFRREVTDSLKLYGEMHRFIPELVAANGFSLTEVPVHHRPRLAGRSKYGLSRTFRVVLDLMTVLFLQRYGSRPMHIFGGVGLLSGSAGFVIAFILSAQKIYAGIQGGMLGFQEFQIGERPILLLAVMLILIGVQFFVMGLLAELSVRTYYESQNKPIYRVRSVLRSR